MHLPKCLCMSVLLMIADGFVVQSPSDPLVVPLGGSVVLPCSVDMLLPVEDLEVQWKRDSGSLVHLFQDGESRQEAQHQDYYDRAHFFTEEIQHGNFSLLLSNVRAEDKGEYRCKVYSDQDSGENVVEIKYVERLIVSGSNHSISPYEGEDLTLSCSVDSHIPPEEIEEVSWKRTDKNGEILVLLFQSNEIITEAIPDQYKDRAEFFADEIPKANFSLRLKSIRAEDKGVYTCLVFAGDFSANTTVDVKISLSTLHIVVLLLCGLSFGSASLLGCLVYKFHSGDFHGLSVLHWSFHLLPNLLMVTAFIIWGFVDGTLNEVISCSTLNLLRPLLLIVTVPQKLTDSWNQAPSIGINHAIFSVVFYSVLVHNAWERRTFYSQNVLGMIFPMFILALLWISAICFGGCMMKKKRYTQWKHELLIKFYNILIICLLYYSFGQSHEETLILPLAVGVVMIFLMIARACKCNCKEGHKFCWSMLILIFVLLESGVMVYYHYSVLEHEKDRLEWTCVAAFVQTLTMMVSFKWDKNELEDLSRLVMYMVGAVGLIFLNSFTLGTQLILNARNSEIIQKDLRAIIFPAEGAFALSWLAYLTFSYSHLDVSCFQVTACKERKALNCCKKPHNKHRSNQKDAQDPPVTHELETFVYNERNG